MDYQQSKFNQDSPKKVLQRSHSSVLQPQIRFKEIHKIPKINLDLDQKIVINRVLKELAKDGSTMDMHTVLQKPHIKQIFKEEFQMSDKEIQELEDQLVKRFDEIVSNGSFLGQNGDQTQRSSLGASQRKLGNQQLGLTIQGQHKSQPLTMLQRKELDHYQELDYYQYPVQTCIRSLYYISKIAQSQRIKIIVPPTILIGFNDDNRMMYNDSQSGVLIVQSGYISPKIISQFVNKHMVVEHQEQTVEERLIFPKFVIRLGSKSSTKNELKLYYSKESLIADLMNFWGTYDMAIQIFIKQKHLRPSMLRYYMKHGNVVKAVAISNQENLHKETRLYKTLMQLIQEQLSKYVRPKRQRPRSSLPSMRRREGLKRNQADYLISLVQPKAKENKGTANNQESQRTGINDTTIVPDIFFDAESAVDAKGFPTTLDYFKLSDYYTEVQTAVSNTDLKRYFAVSSDNIDNLTMMNCRPSAQAQAEKATTDLYRLFSQYYLKIKKYGNISHFVCDFIEAENGLLYLLQVKSFECEGIKYDWQVPFSPKKTNFVEIAQFGGNPDSVGTSLKKYEEDFSLQKQECQAKVICMDVFEDLRKNFIAACKETDLWTFSHLKRCQLPRFSSKIIQKYHKEVLLGKEAFLLESEKKKICPLFPLTTFCEQDRYKQAQNESNQSQSALLKMRRFSRYQFLSIMHRDQFEKDSDYQKKSSQGGGATPATLDEDSVNQQSTLQSDTELPCCLSCFKILELFTSRYYALVFKTESIVEELRKLKLKLVSHWSKENLLFLLNVYKSSKKSLYIVSDVEKLEKRAHLRQIKERTLTPESVVIKSTRRMRGETLDTYQQQNSDHTQTLEASTTRGVGSSGNHTSRNRDLKQLKETNKLNRSKSGLNNESKRLKISKSLHRSIQQVVDQISDQFDRNPGFKPPFLPISNKQLYEKHFEAYSSRRSQKSNKSQAPESKPKLILTKDSSDSNLNANHIEIANIGVSSSQSVSNRNFVKNEIERHRQLKKNQSLIQVSNLVVSTATHNQDRVLANPYVDIPPQSYINGHQDSQSMLLDNTNDSQNIETQNSINDRELSQITNQYKLQLSTSGATANQISLEAPFYYHQPSSQSLSSARNHFQHQESRNLRGNNSLGGVYYHITARQKIGSTYKNYKNGFTSQNANQTTQEGDTTNIVTPNIQYFNHQHPNNPHSHQKSSILNKQKLLKDQQDKTLNNYFNDKREMSKQQSKIQQLSHRVLSKERQKSKQREDQSNNNNPQIMI